MKISARNILKGTVEKVAEDAVNGVVTMKVENDTVKADTTMEAIKDLGLKSGKEAFPSLKQALSCLLQDRSASRRFQRVINYLAPLSR